MEPWEGVLDSFKRSDLANRSLIVGMIMWMITRLHAGAAAWSETARGVYMTRQGDAKAFTGRLIGHMTFSLVGAFVFR
jgi:hypothetical protein